MNTEQARTGYVYGQIMDPRFTAKPKAEGAKFDAWLNHIKAQAWDEGHIVGWDDGARANTVGLSEETPNPYREAPAEDHRRIPCTADRDCIMWDGHNGGCLS